MQNQMANKALLRCTHLLNSSHKVSFVWLKAMAVDLQGEMLLIDLVESLGTWVEQSLLKY